MGKAPRPTPYDNITAPHHHSVMTYRLSTPFDPRELGDQCLELATSESALEVYDREGVKAHTHGREGTSAQEARGGGRGRSGGGSGKKRMETPPGGFGGMMNK